MHCVPTSEQCGFILPGEYPAAMQTGSAALSNSFISMAILVLLNVLYSRQLTGM
jgi:hypothetical protein